MFIVTAQNGVKIKWEDGKFESDCQELLDFLKERAVWHYKWGQAYMLNGSALGPIEYPEKNKFSAFALIQTHVAIKEVEGERMSAEMLWGKMPDGWIP